jgi:hypothetical protein
MPFITTRVTAAQDATLKGTPLTNAEIDQNFINLNNAISLSKDVTGFVDRTSSTISFNSATRTLTLAPTGSSFSVYLKGKEYVINSTKSLQISDTTQGVYYGYNVSTGALQSYGATPDITDTIFVSYIYWDGVNDNPIIFADERHSVGRDTDWHRYQHITNGAIWNSGGDITVTTNNTNNVKFSLSSPVVIFDEDITHSITHAVSPTNPYEQSLVNNVNIPIIYYNNTGYVQTTPSDLPWYPSTTRAYYNPIVTGSGSLAVAPSNDMFIVYWCVATNDIRYPIKLVMGRNAYNTFGEAETENFDSYGLALPEIVPMYKFILKTSNTYTQNTARVNIVSVREIVGKQNAKGNTFDTLSHNALSDRFTANQHDISSITDLQTTLDTISGSAIAMAIALG